jgi:2,4-dienoyl-CoA reductase-like NADH-dependent reductase (Old Yellow Enzyme family)/thioredoxin reductase
MQEKLGNLSLNNPLVMAPVKTGFATKEGNITKQLIEYYRIRARGGVGLIISEPMYVLPSGRELPTQVAIYDDRYIDGLKEFTGAVHDAGGKIAAHINHAGRAANPKLTGDSLMAPSPVPCPVHGKTPKEMTEADIEEVLNAFAAAAVRAKEAGFDAVEVQFGLGYISHQFLSPLTNLREDKWGGSEEGRLRFARELITGVRKNIGPDFPVIARISAKEFSPGGTTLEDAHKLVRILSENGASAIHVANGSACDSPPVYYQYYTLPDRQNLNDAVALKKGTSLPVIATGRNSDPQGILDFINERPVDFLGMGRPLVADPELPNKILDNRPDAVIQCGSCLQACLANVKALKGIKCVVNPKVGRELEPEAEPASGKKTVWVIGAGPAGIKAAVTAAEQGHEVKLFEKDPVPGGQFALSFLAPHKKGMRTLYEDMTGHLSRSGVELITGKEISIEDIRENAPEELILATGAVPAIPPIPGLDKTDYYTGFDIYRADDLAGVNKAVVIGGGLIGMEAAEWLAEKGINVTVVELLEDIARDMEMISRKLLLKRLADMPIEIITNAKVTRIEERGLVYEKTDDNEAEFKIIDIDLLVVATGTRPVRRLADELKSAGIPFREAGDMVKPAMVQQAVWSGYDAAIAI